MRIVQIVPFLGTGTGVAGVATHLDRAFRSLGVDVESFTYATAQNAGRGRGSARKSRTRPADPHSRRDRLRDALGRAHRLLWFSTVGSVRARRFLSDRPDAVSICHNNAMVGDVYVNHGIVLAMVRSRSHALGRALRNPTLAFVHLRDRIRYRGRFHRAVVCLTDGEAERLRATYGRVQAPITVIPNGVDLEEFRPPTEQERQAARELFRLPDEARVALFIGLDFERKGLFPTIEALRRAPSVLLLVVGGAQKDVDTARAHAERHGVSERVMLLGQQHGLARYFAVADMFVMPSAYESSGLVFLESLASGLPVIATPVGIVPEVVRDGENGLIVGRDPVEIGDGLERLAGADLTAWSARARSSVLDYSWTSVARRYLALAEQIAADREAR
jgi:glycosyltransferase involved in cell wall biosynthesis